MSWLGEGGGGWVVTEGKRLLRVAVLKRLNMISLANSRVENGQDICVQAVFAFQIKLIESKCKLTN